MDMLYAAILGIVEGVTEFLPISSTAHLLVGQKLLGFVDDAEVFTVVIQLGAILAAVWFFRRDIFGLIKGVAKNDKQSVHVATMIGVGLAPALIIGLIVELTVGIPENLVLIAATLIAGGVILWLLEQRIGARPKESNTVDLHGISPASALVVGLFQCLAIIPGVSRSGATIASGLGVGLNRATATTFSFYLSIPIMIGASALKLVKDGDQIAAISGGIPALVGGFTVAFVSAFFAVGWLLKYVQKNTFKPFAYYRILAGTAILLGLWLF